MATYESTQDGFTHFMKTIHETFPGVEKPLGIASINSYKSYIKLTLKDISSAHAAIKAVNGNLYALPSSTIEKALADLELVRNTASTDEAKQINNSLSALKKLLKFRKYVEGNAISNLKKTGSSIKPREKPMPTAPAPVDELVFAPSKPFQIESENESAFTKKQEFSKPNPPAFTIEEDEVEEIVIKPAAAKPTTVKSSPAFEVVAAPVVEPLAEVVEENEGEAVVVTKGKRGRKKGSLGKKKAALLVAAAPVTPPSAKRPAGRPRKVDTAVYAATPDQTKASVAAYISSPEKTTPKTVAPTPTPAPVANTSEFNGVTFHHGAESITLGTENGKLIIAIGGNRVSLNKAEESYLSALLEANK